MSIFSVLTSSQHCAVTPTKVGVHFDFCRLRDSRKIPMDDQHSLLKSSSRLRGNDDPYVLRALAA